MPFRRSRALANSAANSSAVRSRPPGATSMFRSEKAAAARTIIEDALDDEHGAAVGQLLAAGGEDRGRLRILPVVDDRLQQVGVAARRNAVEEAPADDVHAGGEAGRRERAGRRTGDVRLVEEHAPHLRPAG